jgi:hypothetical protein
LTPAELRARANAEADELGPVPFDLRERELWAAEWRGAVVLLASLAEYDAPLFTRAALETASELDEPGARELLLEAAQVRG